MTSPIDDGPNATVEVEEVEWIEPVTPTKRWRRKPTPPDPNPSISSLVNDAVQEGKDYLEAQLELVKVKAKRAASQAAGAIVMAVAAVIFALLMLWWTFHTGEVALALVLPEWAASLIMWGTLLLLTIIFATVGVILALGAKNDAPNPREMVADDIATLKDDVAHAKEGADL